MLLRRSLICSVHLFDPCLLKYTGMEWNGIVVYCLLSQYLTSPQVEAILGLRHTSIDKQIRRVKCDQKIQKWTRTYRQ